MFKSIKKMFKKKSKITLVIKNHFQDYNYSDGSEAKLKFYEDYVKPFMGKYDVIVFDFKDGGDGTISVCELMAVIVNQHEAMGIPKSELLGRFTRIHAKRCHLLNLNKTPDEFIQELIERDRLEKEVKNKTSQYFTILDKELESIKKENQKPILWVFDFDGTLFSNTMRKPYINPEAFGVDWCVLSYRPSSDYVTIKNYMSTNSAFPCRQCMIFAPRLNVIVCKSYEFDGDTTNLTKIAKFKIRKIKELSSYYVKNRIVYVDNKTALTEKMAEFGFTDSMTLPQFIETVKDKSFPDLARKY